MNKAVWIALMAVAIALTTTFVALAAARKATQSKNNDSEKAE